MQAERVTRDASEEDHIVGMAETAKCLAMLERDLPQADAMLMEAQSIASRKRMSHYAIPTAQGLLHFYRNEFREAEEFLLEARTLCKSAGERVEEFQANEYLAMIAFERGRYDSALEFCNALIEIGEKLRDGSEAPFARALTCLCRYSMHDDGEGLDAALQELRDADAKHRLAYVLTRAALLDVERGRAKLALERAGDALQAAQALDRSTDIALAHFAMYRAQLALDDLEEAGLHQQAILQFDAGSIARWAWERIRGVAEAAN